MGDIVARDPEMARALLRRAVEHRVDHIDTADFYRSPDGAVRANGLIREALSPYPEGLARHRHEGWSRVRSPGAYAGHGG
jgi:aryl-alcohol dehydrogenase-like predicted oxidoreductase